MNKPMRFTVTEDHIKLLNRLNFRWDDDAYDGAPAVDIKRPYGNSDVINDVVEILGWKTDEDRYGEKVITARQDDAARRIHEEMSVVLQVLVHNPIGFGPGVYANVDRFAPYGTTYRLVDSGAEEADKT